MASDLAVGTFEVIGGTATERGAAVATACVAGRAVMMDFWFWNFHWARVVDRYGARPSG